MAEDDRGVIKIESIADLTSRPKFVDSVDPSSTDLAEILAEYNLPKFVRCGLQTCREPHKHGLLVATRHGQETNIGADCGQKYFPAQYDSARKTFQVRRASAAHLDSIEEYRRREREFALEIDAIYYGDFGGDWSDRCRQIYLRDCSAAIRDAVVDLARSGSWTISVQVAVERDNRIELGFRRDQAFESRKVGVLRGGATLLKSVRDVLKPVRDKMHTYETVDPSTLSRPKRREWSDWARTIPVHIDEARTLVTAAREFYRPDNLELLNHFARNRRDRESVAAAIRAIRRVPSRRQDLAS